MRSPPVTEKHGIKLFPVMRSVGGIRQNRLRLSAQGIQNLGGFALWRK